MGTVLRLAPECDSCGAASRGDHLGLALHSSVSLGLGGALVLPLLSSRWLARVSLLQEYFYPKMLPLIPYYTSLLPVMIDDGFAT